jgi:hypothetical protein
MFQKTTRIDVIATERQKMKEKRKIRRTDKKYENTNIYLMVCVLIKSRHLYNNSTRSHHIKDKVILYYQQNKRMTKLSNMTSDTTLEEYKLFHFLKYKSRYFP